VKLWLRWPVLVQDRTVARYRQHGRSTSAQAIRDGSYDPFQPHAARAEFLHWAAGEAQAAGRNNRDVMRSLRLALAAYPDRAPRLSAVDHAVLLQRRARATAAGLRRRLIGPWFLAGES
jgi:hypothetical protein